MMRAVKVKAFGGIDQFEVADCPPPELRDGHSLIEIKACGLNFSDLMKRSGTYPGGPRPPFMAGSEAAGVVLESAVGGPSAGTHVCAIDASGLMAERAVVASDRLLPLPGSMSFEEGAAFPIQYLTAYYALLVLGKAERGQSVLIHAAAGGVGTAAVQIAAHVGLRIFGTASTAEKRERVARLGAEAVFGYSDFPRGVRDSTGGRGADIVLESVGGDVFKHSLGLLAPLGRLVVFGLSSGQGYSIDPVKLLFQSKGVLGFHLESVLTDRTLLQPGLETLLRWFGQGVLKVQIGHRFPLEEVAHAHQLMADRQTFGKVVLIP